MKFKDLNQPKPQGVMPDVQDFMMDIHAEANKTTLKTKVKHAMTLLAKQAKSLFNKLARYDENTYRLVDTTEYKAKKGKHHPKAIEQYERFYRNGLQDPELFKLLVIHNGIPDIPNQYNEYQDVYYRYHADLLFLADIERVLGFYFLKDELRQRELIHHYNLYCEKLPEIREAERLRVYLDKQKELMLLNQEALYHFFMNLDLEGKSEKLSNEIEQIKQKYDKDLNENAKEYLNVAKKYNELLIGLPNITIRDDYLAFKDIMFSLNCGFYMVYHGDRLLPNTFKKIDLDNLRLFFACCIAFNNLKDWTENQLLQNLQQLELNSFDKKGVLLTAEMIQELLKLDQFATIDEVATILRGKNIFTAEQVSKEELIDFLNG